MEMSMRDRTYDHVKQLMLTLYGEKNISILKDVDGNENGMGMYRGSTDVQIHVYPYKQDLSVITISAVLTYQTASTAELFEWISITNPKIMFGSLGFIEYIEKPGWGNVSFYCDLYGRTITKEELCNAVDNAGYMADKNDDFVVQKFGGLTTEQSLENQHDKGNQVIEGKSLDFSDFE